MTAQRPAAERGGVDVVTFGCRLNAYESDLIQSLAASAGLENAIVVNTCAVTAEAERQARQAIRQARRRRPDAEIIVTGCAAQIDPNRFADMPEVGRVIGNAEKLRADSFTPGAHARVVVDDIMSVRETAAHLAVNFDPQFATRSRAFVEVQQGCDHRCTFCVIPYGRGNSRSAPVAQIVRQVRRLVERGVAEIVLTGVDLTSYGSDLPGRPSLGQMIRRLLAQVPALSRLRLSSIDVAEVDDDLMRLIAEEPRLMPHLHLSLQAGDDMVLKRMKRRHNRRQAVEFCERVRGLRPDVAFGADLIAGFPTETEAQFVNTLALVEDCDLSFLHVFPYSARPGTPAARMPQLAKAARRERASLLRARGAAALACRLRGRIGTTAEVLVEDGRVGRDRDYAPVRLLTTAPPRALVRAQVMASSGSTLLATAEG
ncbi:MAG: tRNA (N(6)-L-threonylcarbamoyladenosine(37)-C(2))-methylthiotransferase MtaB [Alphaproteobacteria bacterium]|nr:tRNA (N(6)-L-threonylcarbamoyladenosine(37)-C(2))-methylthiotransferase MtaB [Alphaproteobacteria bacterium]